MSPSARESSPTRAKCVASSKQTISRPWASKPASVAGRSSQRPVKRNACRKPQESALRRGRREERRLRHALKLPVPLWPHLAAFAPVDQSVSQQRESGEGAEQDHVGQISVGHDMGRRPKRQRQKQRMTRQANDAGPCRVELVIACSPERERVGPADGERKDQADRPHDRQRDIDLPWRPVPKGHMRGAACRRDQPGQHRERQGGIDQRETDRAKPRLKPGSQRRSHGQRMRQEEHDIGEGELEPSHGCASQIRLAAGRRSNSPP